MYTSDENHSRPYHDNITLFPALNLWTQTQQERDEKIKTAAGSAERCTTATSNGAPSFCQRPAARWYVGSHVEHHLAAEKEQKEQTPFSPDLGPPWEVGMLCHIGTENGLRFGVCFHLPDWACFVIVSSFHSLRSNAANVCDSFLWPSKRGGAGTKLTLRNANLDLCCCCSLPADVAVQVQSSPLSELPN